MDRHAIIARLEQYWYEQQAQNPDEVMAIPSAIAWYWAISEQELLWEYNTYIG